MTKYQIGDEVIYYRRSINSNAFKTAAKIKGRIVRLGPMRATIKADNGEFLRASYDNIQKVKPNGES